jgi:hypothetical protein
MALLFFGGIPIRWRPGLHRDMRITSGAAVADRYRFVDYAPMIPLSNESNGQSAAFF